MYKTSSKCIKEKVRTLYYKSAGAAHVLSLYLPMHDLPTH